MKKGFLFCLVILLCFMVTSCENFGVLGLSGTKVYLLLPDNCFLDDSFEKNSGDFVYLDPPYLGSDGVYQDGKRGFKGWDKSQEYQLQKLYRL